MTNRIITMQLLALLLVFTACAPKSEKVSTAQSKQPSDLAAPDRVTEAPADELDVLIPRMASADIQLREDAQKKFEMVCHNAARPGAEDERLELCQRIIMHLDAKSPLDARVWMIRQLEKIGRTESVAALAGLLNDDKPLIRETARRALQHNPADSVRDVIEKALAQAKTADDQIAYLNVLAARRESQSVPIIITWTKSEFPQIAAIAIAALGDIGGPDATDNAGAALSNCRLQAASRSRDRLAQSHRTFAGGGVSESSRPRIFDDLYISAGDESTRFAALRGLTRAKGPAAVVTLLEIMQNADPEMRIKAAQLALEIPGEAVTLTLAMMMSETPPNVQASLLEGLGQRGDPTARARRYQRCSQR